MGITITDHTTKSTITHLYISFEHKLSRSIHLYFHYTKKASHSQAKSSQYKHLEFELASEPYRVEDVYPPSSLLQRDSILAITPQLCLDYSVASMHPLTGQTTYVSQVTRYDQIGRAHV